MSGKLSRTVLRRGKGSNPFSLVDYISQKFEDYLDNKHMIHSFSRKGNPYDNACIESLHSLLKKEEINRRKYYDFNTAQKVVFEYIESWYNRKRIHSAINYMTPQEAHEVA
ncbi:transposase [Clostridium boliviensis]|uniref:transposase n=1 Tax=Clostridium boliviensis TaxID=318465 RepID=UPI003F6D73FE